VIPVESLVGALSDLESGYGAEILVAGTEFGIDPGDEIAIPMGPLLVTGSLTEWEEVVAREQLDRLPADEAPATEPTGAFSNLVPFQVIDSE
jgi:hypothetical protein